MVVILISIILVSTIAFISKDAFLPHVDINIDPVWKIIISATLFSTVLYFAKKSKSRTNTEK